MQRSFQKALLRWFDSAARPLPWRRTRDPYAIWVSEVMLQQTRVAAVIPYYERFLRRFPTPGSLAEAPESDLLSHWAGLGYYSRARNLQRAAREIAGEFPSSYEGIRALPGVGEYTAAAVASIAFGHAHAAVDGNVVRVLSRLKADATVSSDRGHFTAIADETLDRSRPGDFNQAMMELGATVCLPKKPDCGKCPVRDFCAAGQRGTAHHFPVRPVKRAPEAEQRTVFWIERDSRILAWQRQPEERLMAGFWELPESTQLPDVQVSRRLGTFRHCITFHRYLFVVAAADVPEKHGCKWLRLEDVAKIPASTILRKAARIARPNSSR